MKTISFIGSDKNAGKTTALNFVYRRLRDHAKITSHNLMAKIPKTLDILSSECELIFEPTHRDTTSGENSICISSVGINGEDVDSFNNRVKPKITVSKGSFFVTEKQHLKGNGGNYDTVCDYKRSRFNKQYVLGRCLESFETVMEGPNDKEGVLVMKEEITTRLPTCTLLIDGSIDRQFLAHPQISDEIYFSVSTTSCREQMRNAQDLLSALSIPECPVKLKQVLEKTIKKDTKSLLLTKDGTVLYHGKTIPFLDENLKKACVEHPEEQCDLYLNGALSKTLYTFLSRFGNFTVVVDNFTFYRNIGVHRPPGNLFEPDLALLRVVPVKKIFLKQETETCPFKFPENVDVHNLFNEDIDLIKL